MGYIVAQHSQLLHDLSLTFVSTGGYGGYGGYGGFGYPGIGFAAVPGFGVGVGVAPFGGMSRTSITMLNALQRTLADWIVCKYMHQISILNRLWFWLVDVMQQ